MFKRSLCLLLAVLSLFLWGCSKPNDYNLSFTSDSNESLYLIGYDEYRTVYSLGGVVTVEIDGEAVLLDMAIQEGKISVEDILNSVKSDADDGDVEFTEYPDGSIEYYYEGFTLVDMNKYGELFLYFLPTTMDYYSVVS